jgi:hypothetical protein
MQTLPERGFKTVTFAEFRAMKISRLTPRPLAVFVNKRTAFQPPEDSLRRTNDLKSRAKHDRFIDPYRKGAYEREYRGMVVRSSRALKELREIAGESKRRLVLMVSNEDRPDASILVKMATEFMNRAVWT